MTSSFIKEKLTPYKVIRIPHKNEEERQKFRTDRVLSTRFLDNSFKPDIHNNFFKPSGLYTIKK